MAAECTGATGFDMDAINLINNHSPWRSPSNMSQPNSLPPLTSPVYVQLVPFFNMAPPSSHSPIHHRFHHVLLCPSLSCPCRLTKEVPLNEELLLDDDVPVEEVVPLDKELLLNDEVPVDEEGTVEPAKGGR